MLTTRLLPLALLVCIHVPPQDTPRPPEPRPQVFAAIFERGPAWNAQKSVLEQSGVQAHMRNNQSLGDALVAAAPFTPVDAQDSVVGLVVLTAANLEEAQKWLARDPMIEGKVMTAHLRRWHVDAVKSY